MIYYAKFGAVRTPGAGQRGKVRATCLAEGGGFLHSQAKKCRKPGFSPHPSRIPPAGSLCQRPPRRMPQGFPGARGLRPALSPGHTVSLQRYGSHWGWTRGSPRARGHAAAAALPAQCPRSSHRPASPAGAGSPCLSRARDRKVLPRCSTHAGVTSGWAAAAIVASGPHRSL